MDIIFVIPTTGGEMSDTNPYKPEKHDKFFEELEKKVKEGYNTNFHFDRLEWVAQIWVTELCSLIEEKLKTKNYYHPLDDLDG